MNAKIYIMTFLLSFLTLACNKGGDNSEPISNPIEFIEIGKGALYGAGDEGISQSNMIITNMIDWVNLMSQMNSVNNETDNFEETIINFDEFIVIAIFLEVKGSSWDVQVDSVIEKEYYIHVSTQETPGQLTVLTQPFHIIKIPTTEKTIIFEEN